MKRIVSVRKLKVSDRAMDADNCCLCGGDLEFKWGHNPAPLEESNRGCCNICNETKVNPARARAIIIATKIEKRSRALAFMSIISFLGYFIAAISINTQNRLDDTTMWLFNVMSNEVAAEAVSRAVMLINFRAIVSGIFCIIMIAFNRMLIKPRIKILLTPYFLPTAIIISHGVSWFWVGTWSIGWLVSFPIMVLSILIVSTCN